ncbi:hypothetical protein AOB60_26150 [Streptomyces noursei]|uniref:Uncharacterized protein n=1 Tax=Streptomyces noursei TaxID=1971 RepID=A0A2N8P9M7_STRNR|nr:hypothetical protein AOB60_26150 [Streptomyces noursei]
MRASAASSSASGSCPAAAAAARPAATLGHSDHDPLPAEHLLAGRHEFGDGAAVPGPFEDVHGQQGHGLGVIEQHPTGPALFGDVRCHVNHQTLLLMGSQMHSITMPLRSFGVIEVP